MTSLALGLLTGVFSGLFGIGGGLILIPLLMRLGHFSQSAASGTSLVAMLLPVGLLGVLEYYRAGKIGVEHLHWGFWIACGIFFGTYLGARAMALLPQVLLKKGFALLLLFAALRLWRSAAAGVAAGGG